MEKSRLLFEELDKCEYLRNFEYEGTIEGYKYNGITYAETAITYYSALLRMYRDFLCEWAALSETDRPVVRRLFNEIKNKRYIDGSFFFDVPTLGTIQAMTSDRVPRRDIEMVRFIYEMAQQQCYFLNEVMTFLENDTRQIQSSPLTETDVEVAIRLLADYPDILSTSDLATIFDKSKRTIRDWERQGKIINVAEDAIDDKGLNSNGHRKRRMALQFRKVDIINSMNLRKMLIEELS